MNKDYNIIMRECDKRIDYLELPYLDEFYNSFGVDTSITKSMITKFFIEDLKQGSINALFNRLTAVPLAMCIEADYLPDELIIPKDINYISAYAFMAGNNVKKIIINCPINSISKGAFKAMPDLEEVYITEGITAIEQEAFNGCPNLKIVELPKSIQKIDASAFLNCPKLTSLQFDEESIDNLAKIMPQLKWIDGEPDEDGNVDQELDEHDKISAFYANAIEMKEEEK